MTRIFTACCAIAAATSSQSFAQEKAVSYWQGQPRMHTVYEAFQKESSLILEENEKNEYRDEVDGKVMMYATTHRIVKILDSKGVEDFSTMSVPVYKGQVLAELKVRTILPNGKVIDIAREKMKESKGENGQTVIGFAIEGLEKDAEAELLITYKKDASWFGRETFQYSVPVQHATLEIISPARLKMEEKGYNGFPTVSDTLIGETRYILAGMSNIPGSHEETFGFYDANRVRAEYKLSYKPNDKENVRLLTWQDFVQGLYDETYNFSDRELSAVEKYLKSIGVTTDESEETKIMKIENAVKTDITIYTVTTDQNANRLDNVISNKSATESSMTRLLAACFQKAGVKHEFGFSTDKRIAPLDPDFENWNSVDKYLFYFPNQKKFLSPAYIFGRYPFASTEVIGNKGIFAKVVTIGGGLPQAIVDIRTITPMPVTENANNIKADISFSAAMDAKVKMTYTFTGYSAMGLRETVALVTKDKVKELVKALSGFTEKTEDIDDVKLSGVEFSSYNTNKPLQIDAQLNGGQLLEKAGPKYLLKIGDVIGKQSELYQTGERKQPVDIDFPHTLLRTITVTIPAGYKVQNLEALKIETKCTDERGKLSVFVSNYKLDGSTLTVNITESYDQLHLPISLYEDFRKVVNAAADFNKVTLVLEKN
jgi:hypothetical protein